MKFCLKQEIVTNQPPTDRIEKVSGVTEYEALRAEKLFRYEYANQLNTNLLTFAFTVFTAGLIIFTLLFQFGGIFDSNSSDEGNPDYCITINEKTSGNISEYQMEVIDKSQKNYTYIVFVEVFFSCFFLLPCFFSRINFRYTVKNSLRIGQLTDYIREKIEFDDKESWEKFKREYNVNYFYMKPSGVGGAKDIPKWINIISCGLSFAVGSIAIFTTESLKEDCCFLCTGALLLVIAVIGCILECILFVQKWYKKWGIKVFVWGIFIIDFLLIASHVFGGSLSEATISQEIMVFLWLAIFQVCILITPHYDKEIELANCVLEHTRAKLEYKIDKNNPDPIGMRNSKIFTNFLKNSSALKHIINRYTKKRCTKKLCEKEKAKIIDKCCSKCLPIFKQLENLDHDNAFFREINMTELLRHYLGERIANEK